MSKKMSVSEELFLLTPGLTKKDKEMFEVYRLKSIKEMKEYMEGEKGILPRDYEILKDEGKEVVHWTLTEQKQ